MAEESMSYEEIQTLYGAAITQSMDGNTRLFKVNLAGVIDALRKGYANGIVESIDGLPTPRKVIISSPSELGSMQTLVDSYFPLDSEFEGRMRPGVAEVSLEEMIERGWIGFTPKPLNLAVELYRSLNNKIMGAQDA
ncbi:MAG: hypothetical protein KJ879_00985 [Nanoarchaeota archaeon]|nr:hypothetical protein [Nanoarchaeota archaeon]